MIAHMLRHTGYGCNAFLGGISVNYGTNFWSSERNTSVVEADEYDRSFLKLSPDIAIITAMDPDHLDIYGTAAAMEQAFIAFSDRVKPGGVLISKFGLKRTKDLKGSRKLTYSVQDNSANAYAESIKMVNGSYEFDVVINDRRIEKVKLNIGGMHNVENAIAAITAVSSLHIDDDRIKAAVADFKGVKRRFEYIIKTTDLVFIDDYAHHPEELRALISGAKSLFSDKKSTMIFQPHLYTRTRDLADGFAEVLDMADEVILLPVYPARELPIAGVSSEMILDKMKNKNKKVLEKEELKDWVKNEFAGKGVLMTAGAGDIDLLVEPIKEIIK
jgi:UDP-N-acetylmuramate--alanine ligase